MSTRRKKGWFVRYRFGVISVLSLMVVVLGAKSMLQNNSAVLGIAVDRNEGGTMKNCTSSSYKSGNQTCTVYAQCPHTINTPLGSWTYTLPTHVICSVIGSNSKKTVVKKPAPAFSITLHSRQNDDMCIELKNVNNLTLALYLDLKTNYNAHYHSFAYIINKEKPMPITTLGFSGNPLEIRDFSALINLNLKDQDYKPQTTINVRVQDVTYSITSNSVPIILPTCYTTPPPAKM